jgi:hypothetical protein
MGKKILSVKRVSLLQGLKELFRDIRREKESEGGGGVRGALDRRKKNEKNEK